MRCPKALQETPEDLPRCADTAMYEAKVAGRSRERLL
jgi:PleD family two-component response regulator